MAALMSEHRFLATEDSEIDDTNAAPRSGRSHRSRLGIAASLSVAVALVVTVTAPSSRVAVRESDDVAWAVEVKDEVGCAEETEDCSASQCCRNPKMQCFAKNDDWATCMASGACAPGIHEGDTDQDPWSCELLGADAAVQAAWAVSEAFAWKMVGDMSNDAKVSLMSGADGGNGYAGFVNAWVNKKQAALTMNDGPQGYNAYQERLSGTATQFPCLLAVAASFDPEVSRQYADAVAEEFVAKGSNTMLGPDVEVTRATLTGRSYETISGEDPFLGAKLVQPFVKAVQDRGVIAVVKHWLDNNQEIYRQSMTAEVGDRAQHEIYMPVFKAAFDAGAAGVMCAYNKVSWTFACENEKLLKKLLRDDLGFKGFVVSDWGATHDGAKSIKAGLDIEMPLGEHFGSLTSALWKDPEMQKHIDQAAVHVVSAMHYVGHFDGSFPVEWLPAGLMDTQATSDAHLEVAFATIINSAVLLKNDDGTLPFAATGKTIAMIGKSCGALKDPNYKQGSVWAGGGSGYVETTRGTTPLGSIKELLTDATVVSSPDGAAAKGADLAIICVAAHGEEGWDRDNFTLPEVYDLVRKVRAQSKAKVVVLAAIPGAVETEWIDDVDAALLLFMPGEQVGPAVAKMLTGEVSPSGRLPISFPKAGEKRWTQRQYPGWCDDVDGGWCDHLMANFSEGTLIGYRWNDAMDVASAFPFGYGLAYTTFNYSGFSARCAKDAILVSARVTNIGERDGSVVPQLYVGFSSLKPVLRQLRGFQKVRLGPGEATRVTFKVKEEDWSYFDEKTDAWVVASDESIVVSIRDSSTDVRFQRELRCGSDANQAQFK